jgi:hypothetical protein
MGSRRVLEEDPLLRAGVHEATQMNSVKNGAGFQSLML